MALPYWYYKGRTTTPIETAADGPIVLEPRKKFFASTAEVSHLLKQKLVARLSDPVPVSEEKKVEPEAKSPAVELPAPKSSEKKPAQDDSSEHESKGDVITSLLDKDSAEEGEGTSSKPKEKEKESSQKRRNSKRR